MEKLFLPLLYQVDCQWANYAVLDCVASENFPTKRLGYQLATLSFQPFDDSLMMISNQIKKVHTHTHYQLPRCLNTAPPSLFLKCNYLSNYYHAI
jgi:hypothetical protein